MDIKEQGERLKVMAEIFLKKDKSVFIKDVEDNIYFAHILLVGEDTITVQCFGPEQRKDEKVHLFWPMITKLEECEVRS